jgi:HECT-domain (ubiquitin-transferase)
MNLLKLPNYFSKELMKRKLVTAIESGAGFELS